MFLRRFSSNDFSMLSAILMMATLHACDITSQITAQRTSGIKITPPVISSAQPSNPKAGDTVTLIGEKFPTNLKDLIARIVLKDSGSKDSTLTVIDSNTAKFTVPTEITGPINTILMMSGEKTLASFDVKAETIDSTASPLSNLNGNVNAFTIDSSGNLYAGGAFSTAGGVAVNNVAKWNGTSWSALGTGMDNEVLALAMDSSGNLYAGGFFGTAGGVTVNGVAKWNGSSWSALGSGLSRDGGQSPVVYALTIGGSGNLYAGGAFQSAGGVSASYIAQWNGSSWSAMANGLGGEVFSLAFDKEGNLYAGGSFGCVESDCTGSGNVAKWNGSTWSDTGEGLNFFPSALVVDSLGNLYAGGVFTMAGEVTANYIAKWNGSSWSSLGTGMNGWVMALAADSSGNIYAGGGFGTAGGVPANHIAKWNGSSWSALGSGVNNHVKALAIDASGNLYVGGSFQTAGDLVRPFIAKWLTALSSWL
jgi:hypothetical protein